MKFSKMLGSLMLPLAMAGCAYLPGSNTQLEELQTTTPTGTPFTQALAREYLAFARAERSNYSWLNAQHFAKKGLVAARGIAVGPERLADWDVSDKADVAALTAARARLEHLLTTTARVRVPALTATLQVKFDCWLDKRDKGSDQAAAACRDDFTAAAEAIEAQVKAASSAGPVPAVAATGGEDHAGHAAAPVGKAQQFQFFFDFAKASLTEDAAAGLKDLVAAARAAGFPRLDVTGYTDSVGSDAINRRLSLRRARAVATALVGLGMPADRITVAGLGKAQPVVSTADGVREPQNRRVVVSFTD